MRRAVVSSVCFALLGCATEIEVKNELSTANLENVRWLTSNQAYSFEAESARLGPGEVSDTVMPIPEDENASGVLRFDVVSNGRRVALVTEERFKAVQGELKTFSIGPGTRVKNLVASEGE